MIIEPEGGMVVTVGTQWIALAFGTIGPSEQFEIIERTLQFAVNSYHSFYRHGVRFVTRRAVQTRGLRLNVFHVSSTLATA